MTSQNATTHSHTTTYMTHKIPLIITALFTEIADITPELNKIPCRTELYKHTRAVFVAICQVNKVIEFLPSILNLQSFLS